MSIIQEFHFNKYKCVHCYDMLKNLPPGAIILLKSSNSVNSFFICSAFQHASVFFGYNLKDYLVKHNIFDKEKHKDISNDIPYVFEFGLKEKFISLYSHLISRNMVIVLYPLFDNEINFELMKKAIYNCYKLMGFNYGFFDKELYCFKAVLVLYEKDLKNSGLILSEVFLNEKEYKLIFSSDSIQHYFSFFSL